MRTAVRLVAVTLVAMVGCIEPTTSPGLGGGLSLLMPAPSTPLDSGHVVLTGPTNKTVTVTPGSSVTIDSLAAGTYTVGLEGFQGGAVAYFTELKNVSVTAGQSTTETVSSFPSFSTSIVSMPSYTVSGAFTVVYANVAAAGSFVVQRDSLANFSTHKDTTVAAGDTSVALKIPLRAYYVRVRVVDPYGSAGIASTSVPIAAIANMVVSPDTATINPGATKQFAAVATDASGDTVTGVSFFWSSSNQAAATINPQTGLATGVAGGPTTISALGLGVPGGATLTVTGGVPKTLAYAAQPASTTAGTAFSPAIQIEIRDTNNQIVSTARNSVTLAITGGPGGATLVGTATVNAVAGVASFSGLNIQKAGAGYELAASSTGLTGATSGAFNISAGAAANLAFTTQPPATVEGNVTIAPVAVTILDAYGNVVTSATNTVTMAIGKNPWQSPFASGGTLSGTPSVPAVAGIATFSTLSIDRPGQGYTLTASATNLSGAASTPFHVHLTITAISSGSYHTCAIATGGTYCWGSDYYGEIGEPQNNSESDSVPNLVPGGYTFTQISAGGYHTCAITATFAAYCWGYNGNGQLGNGTTGYGNVSTPVAVGGGNAYSSISAGSSHTCAVGKPAGHVWCWGYGGEGQLGDNSTAQQTSPVATSATGLVFLTVSAGENHTCATSNATSNNAYCWGFNNVGQLGDSAVATDSNPALLKGNTTAGYTATANAFATISAGQQSTCGVLTVAVGAGNALCWGYSNDGELGDGSTTQSDEPVFVTGGLTWIEVNTNEAGSSACGISGATAYCWGSNTYGQLGNGDATGAQKTSPVSLFNSPAFTSISDGGLHACGLIAGTGTVECWGYNQQGQLGIGKTSQDAITASPIVQ